MRVFGDYNLFKFLIGEYGYHFQNLHNSYIAILATIGIIGFGLFITFLNIKLKEVQAGIRSYKTENVYLIGLYGIILVSATEAASLCAGSAFAASVISIYLLAVSHEETPIAS